MKTNAIMLPSVEVAELLGITKRAVIDACQNGTYSDVTLTGCNGGAGYLIPLAALPSLAQARYWSGRAGHEPDLDDLPTEQAEALWKRYESATVKLKERAQATFAALLDLERLQRDGHPMTGPGGIVERIQAEHGISKSALYTARKAVSRFPQSCWLPVLVPAYAGGNAKAAEFTDDAWDYFLRHAITPGARLKTAFKRTQREGEKLGWSVPSYDTAKARYEALPRDVRDLVKQGPTAIKKLSPTQRRDYLSLALHEMWSTDSRKLDLMVVDTDGEMGRKGRVFRLYLNAFQEVRSRALIGYAIGAGLNADLVRAGFLDALRITANIRPKRIQPDNGRENDNGEITGGVPWKFRGKVKEGGIIGLWPYLGIDVVWATPAHGQAKPVERLFGTLAGMFETLPEFRGAYCGHKPDARPEEWDKSKAVPLKLARKMLKEEIDAYNRQPHTGHGMDGKSPMQVYEELIRQPGAVFHRVTPAQRVVCTYSAVEVTISKTTGSFKILGVEYRSNQTVKLAPGAGYFARYNPNDLGATVYVYRGEKLVAEAERINLTSFNDKASAKDIMKKRAQYRKAVERQAEALTNLRGTESGEHLRQLAESISPDLVDQDTREILPAAAVVAINRAKGDGVPLPKAERQESESERIKRMGYELDAKMKTRRTEAIRTAGMGTR